MNVAIVISANGYPELGEAVEVPQDELSRKLQSGELWLCTAGCNESGMNDDPPVYHRKDDCRS